MTLRHGCRLSVAILAAFLVARPAAADTVRLERVLLLPSPDRSSIVFELTAEPRHVSTRRLSDSVLELEAGPGVDSVVPQVLKAPANVRFVDSVTVRVMPTDEGTVVRARIALSATAQAVVRSSGRRIYVDVSPMPAGQSQPAQAVTPGTRVAAAARPAAPPSTATSEDAYRAAVRPSVDKLKELGPFLTSAATSGDLGVTTAILPTLLSVRTAMAALQPPEAARGSHTMVLGAVDRIMRALAPEFTGNRGDAVRQSMTTIDVVGAVLVEGR